MSKVTVYTVVEAKEVKGAYVVKKTTVENDFIPEDILRKIVTKSVFEDGEVYHNFDNARNAALMYDFETIVNFPEVAKAWPDSYKEKAINKFKEMIGAK